MEGVIKLWRLGTLAIWDLQWMADIYWTAYILGSWMWIRVASHEQIYSHK
jgi:hypothetical protein